MTARQRLTPPERAALMKTQGGVCIGCGRTEDEAGPFDGEHTICNFFAPGKPDALMCRSCHLDKSRTDMGAIAKVRRIIARLNGTRRVRKKIPSRANPWPKGRKMQRRENPWNR